MSDAPNIGDHYYLVSGGPAMTYLMAADNADDGRPRGIFGWFKTDGTYMKDCFDLRWVTICEPDWP